jgi:hypothetical protein
MSRNATMVVGYDDDLRLFRSWWARGGLIAALAPSGSTC